MATAFDSATGYAAVDAQNDVGSGASGADIVTDKPTVDDLVQRMWPDTVS